MEMGNLKMNMKRWEFMIEELTQGRDSAKLLQNHLDPSAPREAREYLIDKILTTYTKALQMVCSQPCNSEFRPDQINFQGTMERSPSHCSVDSSPDHLDNHRRPSKKRKTLPRWVRKVKVETETDGGLQGPLNDGYNWRKYGQKEIHGAAFPRGYYRCTHLHSRGCIATKQIQKSDDDPTVFQVTYRGHHTCTQSSSSSLALHLVKPGPEPDHHHLHQFESQENDNHSQQHAAASELANAETEDLNATAPGDFFFRCFSFSGASLETAAVEVTNDWFTAPSPATSDSNLLRSFSPGTNAAGSGGVRTPESDMNDQGASAANSPMLDWPEFTLEELGIDTNFSFDNPQLFSFR